jgi:hypothetical protein
MNTAPTPTPPTPLIPPQVVERDDGMFAIGFDDNAPGPFPSRLCALAIANEEAHRARSAAVPS